MSSNSKSSVSGYNNTNASTRKTKEMTKAVQVNVNTPRIEFCDMDVEVRAVALGQAEDLFIR